MPRTVLLTGACGSGKSTLLSVGQRTMAEHFGRTATIDTDVLQMMVDPAWELPEDEWDLELCGWQCWLLAKSFLTHGFDTVIIGSNGFHTPAEGLNDMIGLLLTAGDVHHVTLDASIEEIQRRVVERGSDMTPASVAEHVAWMRARQRDWTCRVDTTSLTPEETVAEIAARVDSGEGRLIGPLPDD
jgi:chloramphenicol 3-O-phosphotransferase